MDKNYGFLGTGWSFPPSFAKQGRYAEPISGVDDVNQSIRIISTTQPGERVMRSDFGCDLSGFAFTELTAGNVAEIKRIVSRSLKKHEKRVVLLGINIELTEEEGQLIITVHYMIASDNSRYNMVFPYYLHEANQIDF